MSDTIMQRQRFLFIALGLLTLWRWALLPVHELSPDEAFAMLRAQHGWWGWDVGAPLLPFLPPNERCLPGPRVRLCVVSDILGHSG